MERVSQCNCNVLDRTNVNETSNGPQQTHQYKTEESTTPIEHPISMKEQKLDDIKKQCSELIFELDENQDAEAIVKKHITQLKKYNELQDIALGLVTMIADQRKLRTNDILEEMKVDLEG